MSDPVVLLSTGDVVGPAGGVTDNSMVLFSGTSGKLVKGNNAVVTAAGLALLDDVNAGAQRVTLGLGNVDNTSDASKPVSTATQTALNLKANINSPTFTGSVSIPTIELGSQVGASNAYIDFHSGAVVTDYDSRILAVTGTGNGTSGYGTLTIAAGVVDMTTGAAGAQTVRVNTAVEDTNSTIAASTAFVVGQASSTAPVMDGTAAVGTSLKYARANHVHPSDTTKAPLASPALTGTPTVPTAAATTNTTQAATTAFVQSQKTTSATDTTSGRVWRTNDLVKTTTPTDATAGRMLKVGDFGLGVVGTPSALANIDHHSLATGLYWFANGEGTPPAVYGYVLVQRANADISMQTFTDTGATQQWIRYSNGSAWSAWKEIALTNSPAFIGTPTAPTPSIGTRSTAIATMQNFANEFGSSLAAIGYQKLPTGLIIQWGSGSPVKGSLYSFPMAFPSAILAMVASHNGGVNSLATPIPTFNGLTQYSLNWSASDNPVSVNWIAIGR